MTTIAPYGTWESPISAACVARGKVLLSYPSIAGDEVWWQESRPSEGGRVTVMTSGLEGSGARELLPAPWYARTRVHEYGGKAYLPVPPSSSLRGFELVFANFTDQRLYMISPGGVFAGGPRPLTPAEGGYRFADMMLSPDGREVWCVRETVSETGVSRAIVAVPLDGSAASGPSAIRVLVTGADFFAFPTPSPDGTRLAWINWDHPRMPWDGTELRVGSLAGSVEGGSSQGTASLTVQDSALVMGGPSESVLAPLWRDEDSLYAVSDASGWWNLYLVSAAASVEPDGAKRPGPIPLCPREEEFAGPLWQLGGRPFAVLANGQLAVLHGVGEPQLAVLDPESGALTDAHLGFEIVQQAVAVSGGAAAVIAGGPRTPWSVVRTWFDGATEVMRRRTVATPDPRYLPDPRQVQLSTGPNGAVVHAFVYPPTNPEVKAPDGELAPYLVHVHGGPTSISLPVLNLETAYFTSRGIGVIDVNYGGSSGYGRAYRERLYGQWGVVDVADVMNAALALADSGEADRGRLGIRGGSAGGWTALAAVTTALVPSSGQPGQPGHAPVFAAAVSYYGVADLRPFAQATHDFESRYIDRLVGPLPEAEELYVTRSPIGHVSSQTCPVLLLQGLDDPIVPPAQSEAIAADLTRHGIPHANIVFEGESHGFRKAETNIIALQSELAFYGQIMGFTPPGVTPVTLT
jgi:dipeptidyl aminopeptidase/acylaminoacyl peptidase